jgi:hypothetical protein
MPRERIIIKTEKVKMNPNADFLKRYRADQKEAGRQEKSVTNDPKYNPAGKGRFYANYAPFEKSSIFNIYAEPDPSASARGAKARKSREPKLQQSSSPSRSQLLKSRGTQSSATRKIIK